MVSLQKNSYLPLDCVTSESKPFEAKGVINALQFTTDYIAYIYWNCIKVRKKTELRSEENALNKTETKIIMQCNDDHQNWPPTEC